jgi:hypothetical protein
MSDPSGGNFPPGGGGKGSDVPRGSSGQAAPTITDASVGESLPDDDDWGSTNEPPIVGVPVKVPAAYAATEMMPAHPEPAATPTQGATIPEGPAATGAGAEPPPTAEPPVPQPGGVATQQQPYDPGPAGAYPPHATAPHVQPPGGPYAAQPGAAYAPQPGAPYPQQPGVPYGAPLGAAAGAQPNYAAPGPHPPRGSGLPAPQLIMLAGVLGGLFLLVGIVVGIVAIGRSKPSEEPASAVAVPAQPVAEPAPVPPPSPAAAPIPPPVAAAPTVAPAAVHPAPKAKKDAGVTPSSSAKPAASTSPTPSTSSSSATPGGATAADAGRKSRKVAH